MQVLSPKISLADSIEVAEVAAFAVSEYWFANGELNFDFDNGAQVAIDMNQLNLQRTVDENAKRGLQFRLNSSPNPPAPSPAANSSSPASPS